MNDLFRLSATEAVSLLRRREIAPGELVEASIARIEAVDGAINALPIRCFERSRPTGTSTTTASPRKSS